MVHGKDVRTRKSGCGLATEMVVGSLWPKSSIYVLVNSLTHSFIHSFVQWFIHSFTPLFIYVFTHLFICTHASVHCSFTPSFIYSSARSSVD